jgi:hypothetical protein
MGLKEDYREEIPKEKRTAKADTNKMSIFEKSRYMLKTDGSRLAVAQTPLKLSLQDDSFLSIFLLLCLLFSFSLKRSSRLQLSYLDSLLLLQR